VAQGTCVFDFETVDENGSAEWRIKGIHDDTAPTGAEGTELVSFGVMKVINKVPTS
jgi:hypothetical protein